MSEPHGFCHVFWIGGGSRAGKSTVARRIAVERGFQVYETDAAMAKHAERCTPEDHPLLAKFKAMDMDQRWVERSTVTMLETFPWYQGECFEMIVDDLLTLPSDPPIIVEGFRLLPRLVLPYLAAPSHATWLLPTPMFREAVLESSGRAGWEFLKKTSDPGRAFSNLLERDQMFTESLKQETASLGLASVEIDLGTSQEEVLERVLDQFGLC